MSRCLLFQELVPLVFCFELPVIGSIQTFPDMNSSFIQQISEKYNVHVSCRTRSRLHATLVVVKGCEWEVDGVKQATLLLINQMCGKVAVSIISQVLWTLSETGIELSTFFRRTKFRFKWRWKSHPITIQSFWGLRVSTWRGLWKTRRRKLFFQTLRIRTYLFWRGVTWRLPDKSTTYT